MSKQRLIAKRMSTEILLNIINKLYHSGVDYIDIHAKDNDDSAIGISFTEDYMDEEYMENFDALMQEDFSEEKQEPTIRVNKPLTDDDLNQLM